MEMTAVMTEKLAGKAVIVRSASQADHGWIKFGLKDLFSRARGRSKLPVWNDGFVSERLLDLIENHLFLIAEDCDGRQLGFLCGLITPHYLYPEVLALTELVFWVDHSFGLPAKRAALELLDYYTSWGRENCDSIAFTSAHFTNINRRSLEKRGYSERETTYVIEVNRNG